MSGPTSPVGSGSDTSEFWLTKAFLLLAIIVDLIAIGFDAAREAGLLQGVAWAPTALAVVATVAAVAKALGYTRSRTLQKLAVLAPGAAVGVAAVAPFAKAVGEAVAEALKPQPAQTLPSGPQSPPSTGG